MSPKKRTSRTRRNPTSTIPPLGRHTYDLHWLDVNDQGREDRSFNQYRATECEGARAEIQPLLADALREHHIQRRRIAECLRTLNHSEAAEFFAQELPKSAQTRKGNFGEVLASEHLVQRYGYAMPVFKLQYRDSNLPMRGEDIVAFELDNQKRIMRVVIGEAKAVKTFRQRTVMEAHERLKSAFQPRPMTLSMLANILYDRGDDELGAQIDRVSISLTKSDFPRSNWIFLINERQPDDPFASIADGEEIIHDLNCFSIQLPDFDGLINALFTQAANP